jgi:hypothetical protein
MKFFANVMLMLAIDLEIYFQRELSDLILQRIALVS